MDNNSMLNFIKYCLGYIKLTRQRSFMAQSKFAVNLLEYYFDLQKLLKNDIDNGDGELINLGKFYFLDPNDVTEKDLKQYKEEQGIARKLDEIYSKERNDPYTKQTVLNFGYYEIEIPIIEEDGIDLENDYDNENGEEMITNRYPLFSLPVTIEKIFEGGSGKYYVRPTDNEIQVNLL
jgi:hypothetical protein